MYRVLDSAMKRTNELDLLQREAPYDGKVDALVEANYYLNKTMQRIAYQQLGPL